jgi:hypothetical protein
MLNMRYLNGFIPKSANEGHHEGVSSAVGESVAPDPNRLPFLHTNTKMSAEPRHFLSGSGQKIDAAPNYPNLKK